jgi:hypothetical protein
VRVALERVLAALDCDVTYHSVPIRQTDLVHDDVCDRAITRELLGVVETLAERARSRSGDAEPAVSAGRDTSARGIDQEEQG